LFFIPGLVENEFYPELDMDSLVQEYNAELQKDKRYIYCFDLVYS